MFKRHVFLAGLIVGSLALATPAYAGGSQGGRQGRVNPKNENPKQENPKHEDSKHEDAKNNDNGARCLDYTEEVRIYGRLINMYSGYESIDFTARNFYVDGKRVGSDMHFTGDVQALGFGYAVLYNSPLLPLSGQAHDRVMLNPMLTSGQIDTTIQVPNLSTLATETITIRVHSLGTTPAVFDGVRYIRHSDAVSGTVLRNGQPWFDFDNPSKPLEVQNWNASTCAPRGDQ